MHFRCIISALSHPRSRHNRNIIRSEKRRTTLILCNKWQGIGERFILVCLLNFVPFLPHCDKTMCEYGKTERLRKKEHTISAVHLSIVLSTIYHTPLTIASDGNCYGNCANFFSYNDHSHPFVLLHRRASKISCWRQALRVGPDQNICHNSKDNVRISYMCVCGRQEKNNCIKIIYRKRQRCQKRNKTKKSVRFLLFCHLQVSHENNDAVFICKFRTDKNGIRVTHYICCSHWKLLVIV